MSEQAKEQWEAEGKCRYCGHDDDHVSYCCHENGDGTGCSCIPLDALEADIAALRTQIDEVLLKDRGKTNEINILAAESRALRTQLAAAVGKAALADRIGIFGNRHDKDWWAGWFTEYDQIANAERDRIALSRDTGSEAKS